MNKRRRNFTAKFKTKIVLIKIKKIKRRNSAIEFETKVVLELLEGDKTLNLRKFFIYFLLHKKNLDLNHYKKALLLLLDKNFFQ